MGAFWLFFIGTVLFAIYTMVREDRREKEEEERIKRMSPQERRKYYREKREHKELGEKIKYNNHMFTCPMCGSKNVLKISTTDRAISIAALGAASSKLGKQYVCDNCKHKF